MKRPTIPDLAAAASVSVSTVNRLLSHPESVRAPTRQRIEAAAAEIGFYGLGSISNAINRVKPRHKLGILLLQKSRAFYQNLGIELAKQASARNDSNVKLSLEYLEDLSPAQVAERLKALGQHCDAVALTAAQHPLISDAIDELSLLGVPVTGLISPLSANAHVSFVGLDYWKVGRTAAWAFQRLVRGPGEIAILVGNHRYRNQEMNEIGFRSYFREHASDLSLLEPLTTHESSAIAHELVETLLAERPNLKGLFISGGGVTGAIAAIKASRKPKQFAAIGYELFEATRSALIEGYLDLVISHPITDLAHKTIETMIKTHELGVDAGAHHVALNFEIYTSENV